MLAIAAIAVLFLVGLTGFGVWAVRHFLDQPDEVIIISEGNAPVTPAPQMRAAAALSPPRIVPPRVGPPRTANRQNFTGNVIDAQTRQPVPNFTARLRYANNGSPFPTFGPPAVAGSNGQFSLPNGMLASDIGYYVRIEAPGYEAAETKVPDGLRTVNFELKPAPDLQGRVLAADGTPVSAATVVVTLPGQQMQVINGKMRQYNCMQVVTGADGKYDLPSQGPNFTLLVADDAGFGQINQDEAAKNADIQLAAWGQVAGRLLLETKPAANKPIKIIWHNGRLASPSDAGAYISSTTQCDADGNFSFDRLAPGDYLVGEDLPQRINGSAMANFAPLGTVQVIAHQTTTVTFGGTGRPVVGKLILPPGVNADTLWLLGYAVGQADVRPPQMPEAVRNGTATGRQMWMQLFLMTPAGREFQKSNAEPMGQRTYTLEFVDQNNFRIDNLLPGDYTISVLPRIMRGGVMPMPGTAFFTMPEIPSGVSDEPLEIADISILAH
jgi:hypothetical protein